MAVVSLIGMSGTGKTYWSQQFTQLGWERVCCDDLIEQRLGEVLGEHSAGIQGVADWLGQPYTDGYQERQQIYLEAEIAVMTKVLQDMAESSADQNLVIDTTGSVIYTGDGLCSKLQQSSRVVYLSLSEIVIADMIQRYLHDPKPVLWGDQFVQFPQQTIREAIASCYPKLVRQRASLYERYAQVTLPYERTSAPDFSIHHFLDAIN